MRFLLKLHQLDWNLIFKVFGVVWLSEMGDKTQVTTLLLAGAKPLYVLWVALGSACALVATSFIETTVGAMVIARYLRPRTIKFASAVIFLLLGVLLLSGVVGQIESPI